MIKKLFTTICAGTSLLLASHTHAQTTVTLGTGTSSSSTYGPFYRTSASSTVYGSAKAMLYTAAELSAVGIVPGVSIQSIKWNKNSGSIFSNGATARAVLYVKDGGSLTSYGSLVHDPYKSSGFVPVDTVDYNTTTNNISGASSWVGFDLNWNYSGGSFEVVVDFLITPGSGSATTGSFTWFYTSTTPDDRYGYIHSIPTPTTAFTEGVQRPNTQITFVVNPACAGIPSPGTIIGPASGSCPGGTAGFAVVGQSSASGLTYQWESSPIGVNNWSNIPGATGASYINSWIGLDLDYRVLVSCPAGGGGSAHTPTFTLTTAAFTPPYGYSFTGFPSDCWVEAEAYLGTGTVLTGTTSSWASETWLNATNGSDVMHNNFSVSSDNSWMVSPSIDLGTGGNYQAEFDIAFVQDGSATPAALGSDDTLAVVVSTDNGATWDLNNVIKLYTASNSLLPGGFEHVILPLSTYTGKIRIGFYASEGSVNDPADTDAMIDTFFVRIAPPTCAGTPNSGTITGLATECPGGTVSLSLSGQSAGTGISYQWESSPVGANTWSVIPFTNNATYITAPITQSADYRVLVTCSFGAGTAYTPTFTLNMTTFTPPYLYTFSNFPSDCWTESDGLLSSNTILSGTSSSWASETWLNSSTGSDVIHNNFLSSSDNEWLISPTINLGAGGNFQLEFDVAFVDDGTATPAALGSDDSLAVVISLDNGVTWDIANVVKLYTATNSLLPNGNEHVVVPLSGYTGSVRFAFYASEGIVDDPADTDGMIDNFRVRLAPTCPEPLAFTSGTTTGYTANLSWTEAGAATLWQVQYGSTGFTLGTGTSVMATSNPFNLTGLTPLTNYDAYVRAVCGPNDTSSWVGTVTFTTTCGNVTIPYLEDFAAYTPACWEERDGQLTTSSAINVASSTWAGDDWLNNATLGPATKIQLSVASDRDWLVSPSIDLGNSVPYQLEFDLALVSTGSNTPEALGSDDTLAVVISTDNGATWSNANILASWTASNSLLPNGWIHVILPLSAYTGTVKIGFYGSEGTVNDPESVDAMIDNFAIVAQPSCPQPFQLNATGISGTTANLGWTSPGPATQWQIEYGPAGFLFGTGIRTIAGSNPYSLTGLTPSMSYSYYVRSICGLADSSLWSGPINFATPPQNDSAVNATLLMIGASCNGILSNGILAGATVEPGEPSVSCEGTAGNFRSVWYKFVAPASGQVRISNDYDIAAPDSVLDTKVAVYQVGDSSDFTTYQILACDDDNGIVGDGYRNIIYVTNLTPGTTYYIKMDKWNATEIDGSFCIDVTDFTPSMISSNSNCGGTAYGNNDWFTGGSAWVSVVDDAGLVIANLKSNASTAIGSVFSRLHQNTGAVRVFGTQPYLDKNYEITVDNQPSSPVDVQFFFTDGDYNALALADPNVSMNSLGATRLPSVVCAAVYDPTGQTPQFLAQTGNGSSNGVRYIVVPTPGFSTFFIHAGHGPLAIELAELRAVNVDKRNRVDWSTAKEEAGSAFVVERSLDGKNFSPLGTVNAKGERSTYSFWDEEPVTGVNHYRLKIVDAAGTYSYSSIVTATVRQGAGFALEAFPNPASGSVTVRTFGNRSGSASIAITDITGKVLLQQPMQGDEAVINLGALAKGMYLVQYTDDQNLKSIKLNVQ